jgi:FAD binding domain
MRFIPNAEPRSAPRSTPNSIPDLRGAMLGRVIAPDDPDYESARLVVTAAVDRRPALIVRPADAADVSLAVSLARANGLELAIRGGGHSLAGHGTSDGGLVLDMSNMRGLHIDPQRRIGWAQAGLTAGQYTAETARHGLTTGFGDTGSVGIVGLTLGGGIGWLVRKQSCPRVPGCCARSSRLPETRRMSCRRSRLSPRPRRCRSCLQDITASRP